MHDIYTQITLVLNPRLTYRCLNLSLRTWTLSATDPISEPITQLPSPEVNKDCASSLPDLKVTKDYASSLPDLNVTEDWVPSPLSPFLALEEETLGDLEELQQTCHALHTELQDTLTYNKGPLSSDNEASSPSEEEVAFLDISMPHHPPVSDGERYADTGWYMPHQNHDPMSEEPSHPVPSCQASITVLCDLLRSSPQPRAGL